MAYTWYNWLIGLFQALFTRKSINFGSPSWRGVDDSLKMSWFSENWDTCLLFVVEVSDF